MGNRLKKKLRHQSQKSQNLKEKLAQTEKMNRSLQLQQNLERVAAASQRTDQRLRPSLRVPEDDAQRQWEGVRILTNQIALANGEYGGYPLPDNDVPITLEPRFPLTSLNGARLRTEDTPEDEQHLQDIGKLFGFDDTNQKIVVINCWYSRRVGGLVYLYVFTNEPNKVRHAIQKSDQDTSELEQLLRTMGCSMNWSVSGEETALEKLRSIVTPVAYRYYVMCGMFMETSKRSGVTYLFHRCRPTTAFKHQPDGSLKVLAYLCGHPIGYYKGTYAGAMVATDDVVSHVLLARGDEHLFWRKCNQHAPLT